MPIKRAQDSGYTTVAETIDPRDWQPGITSDAIVTEINDEIANGHVILLHDAGGDRTETVRALPLVIDRYTKLGYRFVTIASLLGKTRAEVMPEPKTAELRFARIEGQTLGASARFQQALGILFLTAIYLTLARSIVYGILAVLQKVSERGARYDAAFMPPVSVILAAYNEEPVILRTVESILQNGYRDFEVIVVDDGSKDRTLEVLRERYGNDPKVRVLTQPNGGKSAALNNAIAHSAHDILIAVDADPHCFDPARFKSW